jgi:hypothetical protein
MGVMGMTALGAVISYSGAVLAIRACNTRIAREHEELLSGSIGYSCPPADIAQR